MLLRVFNLLPKRLHLVLELRDQVVEKAQRSNVIQLQAGRSVMRPLCHLGVAYRGRRIGLEPVRLHAVLLEAARDAGQDFTQGFSVFADLVKRLHRTARNVRAERLLGLYKCPGK